jgi:hypothetical protein
VRLQALIENGQILAVEEHLKKTGKSPDAQIVSIHSYLLTPTRRYVLKCTAACTNSPPSTLNRQCG